MQVSLGLCIDIAVALALIVWIISHFATISNLKKNAQSKIGNAETKAREIIDDAVKTAETKKKEALLEVKEIQLSVLSTELVGLFQEGRQLCSHLLSLCGTREGNFHNQDHTYIGFVGMQEMEMEAVDNVTEVYVV